jgi:F-type H+-transporting ATPase subunit a
MGSSPIRSPWRGEDKNGKIALVKLFTIAQLRFTIRRFNPRLGAIAPPKTVDIGSVHMRLPSFFTALAVLVGTGLVAVAADPGTAHAVNHGAAHAAHAEEGLPLAAPVLVDLGWFKVTNSMLVMALVSLGLITFAQLATRKVQEVPQGLQNAAEWIVESLRDFLGGILGAKLARETFWFFATVFLFIMSANWFGLLPGVGSVGFGHPDASGALHHISRPLLRGADADLNMTFALAVGFFLCWLFWSIKANGVGGFLSHIFVYHGEDKGILKVLLLVMFFLVGFLEVISIMIRPISLTFRLFGNIYAGESLLETMLNLGGPIFGWLVALPFYGLELMVGLIQALVFTLLTAVFTSLMCTHSEEHTEEGGHH